MDDLERLRGLLAEAKLLYQFEDGHVIRDGEHELVIRQTRARKTLEMLALPALPGLLDRITALQAENERLQIDGIHTCHDDCQRTACVLRREVERWKAMAKELALRLSDADKAIDSLDEDVFGLIHDGHGGFMGFVRDQLLGYIRQSLSRFNEMKDG